MPSLVLLLLTVGAGSAQATTFTDTVDGSQSFTVASSPLGGLAGCGIQTGPHIYTTRPLTAASTASHTFTITSVTGLGGDPFLAVYQGAFNPASPTTNLIACNDDAIGLLSQVSVALTANTAYTLVTTTFASPGSPGSANSSTAPDITLAGAPVLSAVSVSGIGTTTATLNGTSNLTGSGYWVVVPQAEGSPNSAQIRNGQRASGAAAPFSGNSAVTAATAAAFGISGLSASTPYKACLTAETGGLQAAAVCVNFSTSAPAATTTTITGTSTGASAVTRENFTVDFSVAGASPTGNVTVTAFAGAVSIASCNGALTGGATATGSCALNTLRASDGITRLVASYAGDANNVSSSSADFAFSVAKSETSTALASSGITTVGSTTPFGETVRLTATVTADAPGGGPVTGSVRFVRTSDAATLAEVALAGNPAQASFELTGPNTQPVGPRQYTAVLLEPNPDYNTSNGDATHTVAKADTATTISAVAPQTGPSIEVNETVTVTAGVVATPPGAGTPTGTIAITGNDTTGCTITLPAAACNLAFSAKGAKTLTATYSGNASFNGSVDTEVATVLGIPTTITLGTPTPATIFYGNAFSVPFTVSGGDGTFDGTVTVTATGPAPASTTFTCTSIETDGSGTCATFTGAPLGAGSYDLTATYAGDPSDAGSSTAGPTALTILKATTSVSVTTAPNPSAAGASVTLSPVVTITNGAGTVAGSVAFTANGFTGTTCPAAVSGASPASGSCTGVFSAAGAQVVTANFTPTDTANYASASDASYSHTVDAAATNLTITAFAPPVPAVGGTTNVLFSVTGGAGPFDGTIAVELDGVAVVCESPLFDTTTGLGSCGIPASLLQAARDYAVNVAFVPGAGANDGASDDTETLTVAPRATTATLSASPASPQPAGTSITFTANVAADGGAFAAGTVPSGSAFVCLASASPCDATSAICTVTLTGSAGASSGTCNTTFDSAATRSLVVRYAGNADFAAATSPAISYETTAAPTTIAITGFTPSGNTVVGQDLLLAFDVGGGTGELTGTVDIVATGPAGATASCTGAAVNPATGVGSCTFDGSSNGLLRAGSWSFVASFVPGTGSNDAAATSAPALRTVDRAITALTLVSNPDPSLFGNTFALRATAVALAPSEAVPTGNVDFQNSAAASIGSVALDASGVAELTGLTRPAGSYTFRAITATNADFIGAQDLDEAHTVDKAGQVIDFPQPPAQTFTVGGTFAIAATANSAVTGSPSGVQTTFSSTTTGVCTVGASTGTNPSTATVSILSGGTCTIRASAAESSNFNAATAVDRDVSIARAAQTITFGPLPNVSLASASRTVTATSDSGLTVSFVSRTPSVCEVTAPGTNPATVTYIAAGTCTIRASQAGDAAYEAAADVDRSFQIVAITVNPATLPNGTFGTPYSETISATGGSTPYTFSVSAGSLPTGLSLDPDTGAITGTPTSPATFNFTVQATDADPAGPFSGTRAYTVVVAQFQPELTLARTGGTGSVNPGDNVTLQATLTDAPDSSVANATGTVDFRDGAAVVCDDVALVGTGPYTADCTTALAQGTRTLTAVYSGDGNYLGDTSNEVTQVVRTTTTLTLAVGNPGTAVVGQSVTLVANLGGGVTPYQGSVTIDAAAAGSCTDTDVLDGVASCNIGPLALGTYTITASYTGSDDDAAAVTTASQTLVVGAAATTTSLVAAPAATAVLGTSVTLTATVAITAPGTGTLSGSIEFFDGASSLGTQALTAGTAALSTTALPVGTRSLTAVYVGNTDFASSTSAALSYAITRKPVTVAITSAPDTTLGGSTSVAVTVTPAPAGTTPTGDVTVTAAGGGETCTFALSAGAGSCDLTLNAAGSRTISAAYAGDGDHLPGTSAADSVAVAKGSSSATLSIAPAASGAAGAPVSFNVAIATVPPAGGTAPVNVPAASGTVTVRGDDSVDGLDVVLCSFNLPATSCPVTFPTQRTLANVRAIYAGDANFDGSTSSPGQAYAITAVATTTTLVVITPAISVTGQPINVAYSVAGGLGSNDGDVTVTATLASGGPYSTSCTATAAAGTCTLTPLRGGTYNVQAAYAGDANDAPSSSATVARVVAPSTTTTTLTVTPAGSSPSGTAVQLSATVAPNAPGGGTPGGNLVFLRNGASIAVVALDGTGTATFTDVAQPVGDYTYRAQFDSTADYVVSFDEEAHRVTGLSADLSNLMPSSGTLAPSFSAATTAYTVAVASTVSSISLTPTVAQAGATVTVNGVATASGVASAPVALPVGVTVIPVVVTSESGTVTKTYTVTVTRPPSSVSTLSNLVLSQGTLTPAFAAGTTSYTASVGNAVTSITVTPTVTEANATVTVNGTPVASGAASAAINLAVGSNTVTVVVTAQDGSTTTSYTVGVTRAQNGNADLSALTLSQGTLTPAFAAGTTSYAASVGNAVTSITVTPTVAASTSTVTVNGVTVASGSASAAINLAVGPNTVTVVVTAQDATTRTYTVVVTRAANANADLSALALSQGTLTPAFAAGTTSYTASVGNAVTSITVTPTVAASTSTVTVNGTAVASGTASAAINLAAGPNTITVVVTAEDTTTRTYTVTVTRAPSSVSTLSNLVLSQGTLTPAFAPATTSYTASVGNAVTSITVTPTVTEANATVTVNGTAVASGAASTAINLAVGPNTITVVVTAQDGSTTTSYTVGVTRAQNANADLSALALSDGTLTPAFAAGTTSYTASVGNAVTSITVTPTVAASTSTVTVNGVTVVSGAASAAINLAVGPNTITVVVTAQDSSTKTYTVVVTRAQNSNANLGNLVLSQGTLTPAFATGIENYTASVPFATTALTVTPTTTVATSIVTVNGTAVASGTASAPIALNVGTNTITVLVTAQDPSSTRTYTVVVTRASNVADLSVTMQGSYGPGDGFAQFTIVVSNPGPANVLGAVVASTVPSGVAASQFACSVTNGATCGGSTTGTGIINRAVDLPAGSTVTFSVIDTLVAPQPQSVTRIASVTAPIGIVDPGTTNNTASVTLVNALFADGFESGSGTVAPVALGKGMPGAWNDEMLPLDLLADVAVRLHPVEALRFVRGESTMIVQLRRFDDRVQAQLLVRTGKGAWTGGAWVDVPKGGVGLHWLGTADGDAVEQALLRR